MAKRKIIYDENGNIDWNANGWPEPNPGAETYSNGMNIDSMPNDIFDIWMNECDRLEDNWEVDW